MPRTYTTPLVKITYTGFLQPLTTVEVSPDTLQFPTGADGAFQLPVVPGPGICGFNYGSSAGINEAAYMPKLLTLSVDANWCNSPGYGFSVVGASLTALDLPNMQIIAGQQNGGLTIFNCTALTTLNLPKLTALQSLNGSAGINVNGAAISELNLPALTHCVIFGMGAAINVANCPNLTTISAPNLTYATGLMGAISAVSGNGNIANVTLGTIGKTKMMAAVTLSMQKLTQASVDNTLALLASLDGNNGTILFGPSQSVNLSGGTSATPTSTADTANTSGVATAGGTATFTLAAAGFVPPLQAGDLVTIAGVTPGGYNGTFTVTSAADATHFAVANGTTGAITVQGTVKRTRNKTEAYYYKQLIAVRGATVTTN